MENFEEILNALDSKNRKLNEAYYKSLLKYNEDDSNFGINLVSNLNRKELIEQELDFIDDEEMIDENLFDDNTYVEDEQQGKYYVNPLIYNI